MKFMLRAALTAVALVIAGAAVGQSFPSRPVTLTVGFAAGGGTDTAARIIAQKLSENLGQSVVVENRAGANGTIANDLLVKSAASPLFCMALPATQVTRPKHRSPSQ